MLYKYLPPERADVLQAMRIRFTSVVSLNDPFECLLKVGENDYQLSPKDAVNSVNFVSLSRNHKNLLMWAHYADCHKGFVVAFHRNHSFFRNSNSVRYRRLRSDLNGASPNSLTLENVTKSITLEKAVDWAYEEEERLFLEDVPEDLVSVGIDHWQQPILLNSLPKDSLAAVYLGLRASDELIDRIKRALSENGIRIPVYRAKTNLGEFSLTFDEVKEFADQTPEESR
ncbi:DUF2971 domain-containing protein [Pseudoalteromonas sp. Cnat2-41]|uniref:DUF2971 domain-containing protein n=1 Tax=unclassified Pseudoalteromonas TaxID=194690 RepID=UPI001EF831E2|nr:MULTISPECIES: DUF2971 domain-containing protein [unclassified Pseudoalteromonas]MCF2860617.1 DUF2971 domain-containing protein [Pseudoalteromonas sp. CNAT2-18]MCG7556486.1 DUF2971 domain-containing protein [Pseudoalteromonas sp. CNAT2-18.1]